MTAPPVDQTSVTASTIVVGAHVVAPDAHEADVIGYDNSGSGLTATDVQAAIDELEAEIGAGTTLHGLLPNVWDAKVDGGLAGDGATDDTAALQTLIDTATASGTQSATIYFPAGVYVIGGALQEAAGRNAQILLPEVAFANPQVVLTFIGASRPGYEWLGPGVWSSTTGSGFSVIKSTLAGATGTAACISGGHGTGSGAWNNIATFWKNLLFAGPDDPTFTMLNLAQTQGGGLDGVQMSTPGGWSGSFVEPTHSNAYGVRLPMVGCSNYTLTDGLSIGSWYTCLQDGELAIHKGLMLGNCIVAIEEPGTVYPSLIINVSVGGAQYGIRTVSSDVYLDILQYQAEHASSGWRSAVYDLDDAGDYFHGHIRSYVMTTGGTVPDTFNINGGANAFHERITKLAPASGVTPGTYGDATHVAAVTVDEYGRVTAASEVDISGTPGGGQYRQWLYTASGGNLTILTDADGNPLVGLCDLE